MATIIRDGIWSSPQIDGPPRFYAPFQHISDLYVFEQDYVVDEISFGSTGNTALNSISPDFGTYYLVEETQPQMVGAGVRKFTRKYAQIPVSWSESAGIYAYNFIGIVSFATLPTGRVRQVLEVPMRIQRDYFLIGTGGTYSTVQQMVDAVTIPQQTYALTLYPSSFVQLLTPIGADVPTTPSADQYLSWIGTKTEIAVETSAFVRWMGNIWCRETRYVESR